MNKKQILKRMGEISAMLKEDGADVTALEAEYRDLKGQLAQASLQEEIAADINAGQETRAAETTETPESAVDEAEKRGMALMEKRAVTMAASNIVAPQHTSSTINPTFNEVSSLIDAVDTMVVVGGESFQQPYIKGYGTGDYTAESADYAAAEPVFGYADIGKTKVTAFAETTEELKKLPAANYDAVIQDSISKAMRKKITREMLVGDGSSNHFTGIFYNPAEADKQVIDPATDLEITEIGVDTLDDIIFSYGGEENTESAAVLILSKRDLRAFAKLRGTDKKKLHDIKVNGNTGTIDGVPYILNSACSAVSDPTTEEGKYAMAYGFASSYLKVIFSDVDIQFDPHYNFKQGNTAHRGSVFMGGNVVAQNGFIRVKKGTA